MLGATQEWMCLTFGETMCSTNQQMNRTEHHTTNEQKWTIEWVMDELLYQGCLRKSIWTMCQVMSLTCKAPKNSDWPCIVSPCTATTPVLHACPSTTNYQHICQDLHCTYLAHHELESGFIFDHHDDHFLFLFFYCCYLLILILIHGSCWQS